MSVAFPATPLDITVEIFYDSAWNDITDYVFDRDGRTSVSISRGRSNGSGRCEAGRASLQIDNTDGRFSPRNPNSPLFGKIGRNTKLRIKITENAVTYVRFVGEVSSWPTRWDPSESDVWVPIEAYGILRRLEQGAAPLRSALYRSTAGLAPGDYVPHAYWPLEDGSTATQASSALPGRSPATVTGPVSFAADDDLLGSQALPSLEPGALIAMPVPTSSSTDKWVLQLVLKVGAEPLATTTFLEADTPGGENATWRLSMAPGSPTEIRWYGYDSSGAATGDGFSMSLGVSGAPTEDEFYGRWWYFALSAYELIGDTFGKISISDGQGIQSSFGGAGGALSQNAAVSAIRIYGGNGISAGHAALFTDPAFDVDTDALHNAAAMNGWAGEQAHERVERLCREQGIPVQITGGQSALMGPQRIATLLDLLEDCAATDRGFLYEQRDDVGLAYRCNSSRYGQ